MRGLDRREPVVVDHCDVLERRQFGRRSTRVHCWLRPNRRTRIACIMTDYSLGGARLVIEQPIRLPLRFGLCFDGFDEPITCEARHESAGVIGVEFVRARDRRGSELTAVTEDLLKWLAS